jgi:hypothetical protein
VSEIVVFKLELTDEQRLEEAFGILFDREDVPSCTVDSNSFSAHFTATSATGTAIVERIYAAGGLKWCSRHALDAS